MYESPSKSYSEFENQYVAILNSFSLMKCVFIQNNRPLMSKKLHNAVRKLARLKSRANLSRKDVDIQRYQLYRNLVVSMNREAKEISTGILILRKWEKRRISAG